MTCQICIDYQRQNTISNLKIHNTFITGCSNMKISAVTDHEKCKSHLAAVEKNLAKSRTTSQIRQAEAGRALRKLKDAEIGRLRYLVRNVHAVIKGNRPLTDFNWLCELDKAKGLDLGDTYLNSQAALILTSNIADSEREKTINMLGNNFYGIMMDGSTDISGDEQEAIYIRFSNNWKVTERFLGIGSPESTRSVDLEQFVLQMLDSYKLDKAKLISLGSDGASNMTGVKAGLATLLKKKCEF
ncbi:hypothetical protein KUTeg_018704 [Tegillarca granosa]|uniref:DUF4371 domain-containing protein n=1 Tax=Tegillarca granosa TaxID=220873 RepID=A0ABQ9EH94_TEGGR|nr:hypothetical protein KUTeg_018704 [Tegillarca granosa]